PKLIPLTGTTLVLSQSVTFQLSGTIPITFADTASGTKSFTINVYDDDLFSDDLLESVQVEVPTMDRDVGNTAFSVTCTLASGFVAPGAQIYGSLASSGEWQAEIFYRLPDGSASNTVLVSAYGG